VSKPFCNDLHLSCPSLPSPLIQPLYLLYEGTNLLPHPLGSLNNIPVPHPFQNTQHLPLRHRSVRLTNTPTSLDRRRLIILAGQHQQWRFHGGVVRRCCRCYDAAEGDIARNGGAQDESADKRMVQGSAEATCCRDGDGCCEGLEASWG
jgi:hypothetical protein